jgi:hypothetical protein
MEESMDAIATITQKVTDVPLTISRNIERDSLKIRGIGPGLGLEALIAQVGPVTIHFSADAFVNFPLSGDETSFTLRSPGFLFNPGNSTPSWVNFRADNPHAMGFVSVRFGFAGESLGDW